MLKRLFPPALLTFSALVLLLAPTRLVLASDCGGAGADVCGETVTCTGYLWWKKCKTSGAKYWNML